MRIVMILASPIPSSDGIGQYAWNLACHLKRRGHSLTLLTRGDKRLTYFDTVNDIEIGYITFLPVYPYHVHLHNLFMSHYFKNHENQFDLVHLHSPLVMLPHTKLPALVTIHSPLKANITSISSARNWVSTLTRLQAPISYRIERDLFLSAQKLMTTSQKVLEDLAEYEIDLPPTEVVGNGVDISIFYPRKSFEQQGSPYFLTVARLVPVKGLDDLLECAAFFKNDMQPVKFLIAGSGPLESKLRARIKKMELENVVKLLGNIKSREELAILYSNALAYLHPSHYEGLPTSVLEAMACACPVIATSVGGMLDIIQNEINGILVPPHQPDNMAMAIRNLSHQSGKSASLGKQARRTIIEKFSWDRIADEYEKGYLSVISNDK